MKPTGNTSKSFLRTDRKLWKNNTTKLIPTNPKTKLRPLVVENPLSMDHPKDSRHFCLVFWTLRVAINNRKLEIFYPSEISPSPWRGRRSSSSTAGSTGTFGPKGRIRRCRPMWAKRVGGKGLGMSLRQLTRKRFRG